MCIRDRLVAAHQGDAGGCRPDGALRWRGERIRRLDGGGYLHRETGDLGERFRVKQIFFDMKFSSGLAICASSLPFWEHKSLEVTFFLICVYTPDCTDFSGNGIGPVTPMSCTVTETLNGEWELTLTHPLDDAGKWRRLVEGCIPVSYTHLDVYKRQGHLRHRHPAGDRRRGDPPARHITARRQCQRAVLQGAGDGQYLSLIHI